MKTIDKPGVYVDFPEADYFKDPCPTPSLSQSLAKVLIAQTELHAKCEHPRFPESADDEDDGAEKYDKAKAIGNAAHKTLIGRGKSLAIGPFDNWQTKDAKAFKAEAIAGAREPILEKHMNVAHKMVLAARLQLSAIAHAANEPLLLDAFKVGQGEVVVAAEADGIWLRSLIDWMASPTLFFDYKSTGLSVAPHSAPKLIADAGWQIQQAMHERILDLIDPTNVGRRRFFFVAQENYKPFAVTVHELDPGAVTIGEKMLAKAEDMWRGAVLRDQWPAYVPMIYRTALPGWHESQWLNREIADAARERVPAREKMLNDLAGG